METVSSTLPLVQPDGNGGHAQVTYTQPVAYHLHEAAEGGTAFFSRTPDAPTSVVVHGVYWATDTDGGSLDIMGSFWPLPKAGPGFFPFPTPITIGPGVEAGIGVGCAGNSTLLVVYSEVTV